MSFSFMNHEAEPATRAATAAGSVSFKAYLSKKGSDKPVEVRRFGVEQNEVTSFELLKAKLRQVFPHLSGQDFTIGWKDFENDEIIISSNEELITFLTETNDQVRRLYLTISSPISVTIKPHFLELGSMIDSAAAAAAAATAAATAATAVDDDNDSEEDDDEEEDDVQFTPSGCKRPWQASLRSSNLKFHPHVYCDGCQKHIAGHRYKCLECPDFDLCIDCESQYMHKEHVMLRIPLSMSFYPKLNNFAKGMHYMSEALRKIESRIKKQERRMHKSSFEFASFSDLADMAHHSKRCKRDDKEKDKKKDDKREKRDKRDKRDSKEKECSSSASAGCSAEASGPSGAKTGCPFSSGLLSSFLNPQTIGNLLSPQNLNTLQQLFEQMSPVPEQLLQEVAQNLADVRLSDPAPSAPASAPAAPPAGSSTPTNPFSVNAKKPSEAVGAVPSTSSANQSPVAARKGAEAEGQAAAQSSAQPETSASASASASANGRPSGSFSPVSGRSSRSSSEEADPEGWTVVDAHLKDASAEQPSVYPKLPAAEPTPEQRTPAKPVEPAPEPIRHSDPAVQKCLRALAEMGFDVHQRMIVQLAEQSNGRLDRVLNALMP